MHMGSPESPSQLNADAPWDAFDPQAYVSHNYKRVIHEDAEIISIVRAHFSDHFRGRQDRPYRGIDVGAGANLYPAFSMLPWCEEITLLDRADRNVEYLEKQRRSYDESWDAFWHLLCQDEGYATLPGDPRDRFAQVVGVEQETSSPWAADANTGRSGPCSSWPNPCRHPTRSSGRPSSASCCRSHRARRSRPRSWRAPRDITWETPTFPHANSGSRRSGPPSKGMPPKRVPDFQGRQAPCGAPWLYVHDRGLRLSRLG